MIQAPMVLFEFYNELVVNLLLIIFIISISFKVYDYFTFKGKAKVMYNIEEKYGKKLMDTFDFHKLNKPIIGVGPFTSNKTKNWEQLNTNSRTSPKWQALITYLSKKFSVVTFHYTPLKYKNCLNLGNLSPNELGYAISKLDLLLGCEAGLTHFAGILNIPMVVLVGSSSPLVLRHYTNVRIVRKGDCHSCNRFIIPTLVDCKCGALDNNPNSLCLTPVTVEDMIEEIKLFKGYYFKTRYNINV